MTILYQEKKKKIIKKINLVAFLFFDTYCDIKVNILSVGGKFEKEKTVAAIVLSAIFIVLTKKADTFP